MTYAGPFIALVWPTLLSAVIVFAVSSVIHMMSPWHKNDYSALPNEDGFRKAVGPMNIPPGDYLVPRPATRGAMNDPAFLAKANEGPKMLMTVMPSGMTPMAKPLIGWFIYCVVVNAVAGHIAWATLPHGSSYRMVFHTVGLAAFAGYGLALWQAYVWFGRSMSITLKGNVDGLIYAAITGATFGWLWPK